jgi:hypothetical protein
MPSAANQLEHRSSNRHAGEAIITQQANDNKQITYAAATAKHQDNTVTVYKAATFHTGDKDST